MSMTHRAAYNYLNERYDMDKQDPEVSAHMINDLMDMKHKPWCRTHLAGMFPSYGADCTCGLLSMEEMVRAKWSEGPEAVAEYLNGRINWTPST